MENTNLQNRDRRSALGAANETRISLRASHRSPRHSRIGHALITSGTSLLFATFLSATAYGQAAATTDDWAGDSASIQKALDAAAAKGDRVSLVAGRYRLDAAITIPEGVSLAGVWDGPHHAQLRHGTVFMITAGKDEEDGQPLVTLNPSTTISGITFFYPDQRIPGTHAYPWTIQGRGMHGNIADCTFVNSYKAIDFGTHSNELHSIRNCFGCPLKVGVFIDRCTDIGRVENVHFNPHYWARAEVPGTPQWNDLRQYLWNNLIAFDFARTDWEYVLNTFCFGAKAGYRFRESKGGTVNGNFLGIGADWCQRAILVEASQPPGLLITNGEFVGGEGSDAMMEVIRTHHGVVQLSNCAFWGPCETPVRIDGNGSVSLSQCNFQNFIKQPTGACTVDVLGGDVSIQSCKFGTDLPDIHLGPRVETAILMGNWFRKNKEIRNESHADVQELASVIGKPPATRPAAK